MRSMSAHSEQAQVWHYDGASGVRRSPLLVPDGDGFMLVEGERRDGPFAFADLVAHTTGTGDRQFGMRGRPGWRIGFVGEPPAPIAARLPGAGRYGGVIDRIGLWPAAAAFLIASAAVIAVIAFTPALLARVVPRSLENRLGNLMVGDFGERTCSTPQGDAALRALVQRMNVAPDVDVRVVNVGMVNAVTLPGGHVLLFRGMINQAKSPEEVAGVLAHEVGHVEHRHVLQALLRQMGLSVILGGLDGNVGGYTNALLSAGYSRSAEAQADGYAIDSLAQAGISPLGAAAFFRRLSGSEVKGNRAAAMLGYLSSHPMSSERQARFAAASKGKYAPALNVEQWQALRTICNGREGGWRQELGI